MNGKSPFQFGISTMFVITTIAAVLTSIGVMLPPLGIALAVLSVPASIRSYVLVLQYRKAHYAITAGYQSLLFVSSLCISWLILMAAAAAFVLASAVLSVFLGYLGVAGGAIVGLGTFGVLLRRWFRYPIADPGDGILWHSRGDNNGPTGDL